MMWRCPQPERAKQIGCLDIDDNDRCLRNEWSGTTYFKESDPDATIKAEVYCERIKAILREL